MKRKYNVNVGSKTVEREYSYIPGRYVFAGEDWMTALFMIIGTFLMIPAYPLYRRISRRTKAKLTPRIIKLSEEIINS